MENQDCFTCQYDNYDLNCWECRGCNCNFGTRTDKWRSKKILPENRMALYMTGKSDFGSFETSIMRAITLADFGNLKRISKGFPSLVEQYLITMEWTANDIRELIN